MRRARGEVEGGGGLLSWFPAFPANSRRHAEAGAAAAGSAADMPPLPPLRVCWEERGAQQAAPPSGARVSAHLLQLPAARSFACSLLLPHAGKTWLLLNKREATKERTSMLYNRWCLESIKHSRGRAGGQVDATQTTAGQAIYLPRRKRCVVYMLLMLGF